MDGAAVQVFHTLDGAVTVIFKALGHHRYRCCNEISASFIQPVTYFTPVIRYNDQYV